MAMNRHYSLKSTDWLLCIIAVIALLLLNQ